MRVDSPASRSKHRPWNQSQGKGLPLGERGCPRRPSRIAYAMLASAAIALGTAWVPVTSARGAEGGRFRRGDADGQGGIALTDAIFLLNFLFRGGRDPVCPPVADSDSSGNLNLTDAVFILRFLFTGGASPAPLSQAECDECEAIADPAAAGRKVYSEPDSERDPTAYPFACATCHADVPEAEALLLLPGSTLWDAIRRPSFKQGQLDTFLEAANVCRQDWMQTTVWTTESPAFQRLLAFLESIAPEGPAEAVVYEISPPTAQGPATGEPGAGCELFHRSCVVCHGEGGDGSELGPDLFAFPLDPDYIRAKVRLSGPTVEDNPDTVYEGLIGGRMPFWGHERLSDSQLEDLTAYLTGGERGCDDPFAEGRRVYSEPDPDRPGFARPFACGSCHAIVPDDESELRFAGSSLWDAVRRPSFKLGQLGTFLEAANICREEWMLVDPWTNDDPDYVALSDLLQSVAPQGPVDPLVYEIREPTVLGPSAGDPQAGCEVFHRSCVVCHAEGAVGSDLGPGLVSFPLGADFIRQKVRLSGPIGSVYDGLQGGVMPFWGGQRLSDAELEDLVAYLEARPITTCGNPGQ